MMNNFKSYKWFGGMASLAILLFLSACTKDPSFEKKEEAYLTVSPKTLTFKPSADSQELTVEASGSYIARSEDLWCTVNQNIVSVSENTTGKDRSTIVTIRLSDGTLTQSVSVMQAKGDTSPEQPPVTPTSRFADTGKDVPAYPSYNKVSSLEYFPRIDITTDDGQPVSSKTVYKTGKISFKDPEGMYSDVKDLGTLTMKIKGRGNTTWNNGDLGWGRYKNPYKFKLDAGSKIFGMKKDKDW